MLTMTRTALLAAAMFAASFANSQTAAAQDQEEGDIEVDLPARKRPVETEESPRRFTGKPGPLRVYGGISLAVGGSAKSTFEEFNGDELTISSSLYPTIGLQGGAEYVVMDYFAIAGETRFLFFKADGQNGRSLLWDLVVKPKGRYEFDNIPLEVYGALPIGLTVPGLKDDAEGKVGFNFGLVGGATWFFNEKMGINAEIGWHLHRFGEKTSDTAIVMNQFLLIAPSFVYVL